MATGVSLAGLPAYATNMTRGIGMGWRGPCVNIGTTANDCLTSYPPAAPSIRGTVTATVMTISGGKTLVDPAGSRVDLFSASGGDEASLADGAPPLGFSNVPMGVHATAAEPWF